MKIIAAIVLAIGILASLPADATEMGERDAIKAKVVAAFADEDFSRLDAMADEFRRSKSRTSSGLWHLTLFYAGLGAAFHSHGASDEGWTEVEHSIERWAKAFPNSPTAHVAYGIALIDHGWFFRGDQYAYAVPPDAWAPFSKYIGRAHDYLLAHKTEASIDPRWYETMLIIARAQDWDEGSFRRLLDEALLAEPDFYRTYFAALEYLLPKWHGDLTKVEKLANEAVIVTRRTEGMAMYARIYWYASQTQFGNNIFSNSLVVWPKMKTGFDDIIKRYPDTWNTNNYARFACLARDRKKAKQLFPLIGASPVAEAWSPPELFTRCRSWAMKGSPALRAGRI
jgi:hypothetical protein